MTNEATIAIAMNHLKEVNKSYLEHLAHSWSMAFALIIHGLFPFLLKDYASKKMCEHEDPEFQKQKVTSSINYNG